MEREYIIIVHRDESGGFWTEVPALPGCGSQGDTIEQAVDMTKDAIQGYLASLLKHGERPRDERNVVVRVRVAA